MFPKNHSDPFLLGVSPLPAQQPTFPIQEWKVRGRRAVGAALVRRIVESQVRERTWSILGEPRLNVLALNLALDRLAR